VVNVLAAPGPPPEETKPNRVYIRAPRGTRVRIFAQNSVPRWSTKTVSPYFDVDDSTGGPDMRNWLTPKDDPGNRLRHVSCRHKNSLYVH
jgi:hypothetical protein